MLKVFFCHLLIFVVIQRHVLGSSIPDVVRLAKLHEMRSYMNESLRPCTNFYEFACANFAQYHPMSDTDVFGRLSFLELLSIEYDDKLKILLATQDESDTKAETNIKNFYASCMHLLESGANCGEKLRQTIEEFGQMPVLVGDSWRADEFDWTKTVAEIHHKYIFTTIVAPILELDFKNNSEYCMIITKAPLLLPAKPLYTEPEFEDQRQLQKNTIALYLKGYFGVDSDLAIKTAEEILDFEIALVQGDDDDRLGLKDDEIYTPTTIEEMQRNYQPEFNVSKLMQIAWGSVPSYRYYERTRYVENLVKVIGETPKYVVANYIYYNLMEKFIINYDPTEEGRKNICIDPVKKYFSTLLQSMIYRKYKLDQAQQVFFDMWSLIKSTFRDILDTPRLAWLSDATRQAALAKLNAMDIKIDADLNGSFSDVAQMKISKDDYVENLKTFYKLAAKELRESLYEPPLYAVDETLAGSTPSYLLRQNQVVVPVTFLQSHLLYSPAYPKALNFAKIGSILSHELIHGFDDTGRLYDERGNLRNWWDANSIGIFEERTKCFVDQYSRYIYAGKPLAKSLAQHENIADNGGLRLAYYAYLKWYQDAKRTPDDLALETFPHVHYTNKQLFFIGFAQLWCTNMDEEYKLAGAAIDDHTPNEYRVVGPMTNLDEVSQEFDCPWETPMRPIKKCEIY